VIEKINGKLTEERFRNFPPLTDEQKEEMTEKQIELWEEKAKSGLLRGDAILTSGLNQMRLDLYSPVAGDALKGFKQLTDIGISTTANYLDRGKLTIDENKLREKIQENPEAIYKLFMSDGESYNDKGIARRLRDSLKGMMTKIKDKAGTSLSTNDQFTIGKNLKDLDNRINAFQDRLIQIESRYYRQFTAMEQAIQRANQQSAYLMQLFGGGA
jgi:flagellar hook-associated protein 2